MDKENIFLESSISGAVDAAESVFGEVTDRVFVVLTKTETFFGNSIRAITKERYNHVSLSFDPLLRQMYSFSVYTNGMAHEDVGRDFRPTDSISVYVIEAPKEKIEKLKEFIEEVSKKEMSYAFKNLVTAALGLKSKLEGSYFCSWFVSDMLSKAGLAKYRKDSSLKTPVATIKYLKKARNLWSGRISKFLQVREELNLSKK